MNILDSKPAWGAAAAALVLSACTMIPKYEQPQVSIPETFKYDRQPETGIQAASLGWATGLISPLSPISPAKQYFSEMASSSLEDKILATTAKSNAGS